MRSAIVIHNALRAAGYLPAAVDLELAQCPTRHVEFMEALAMGDDGDSFVSQLELDYGKRAASKKGAE